MAKNERQLEHLSAYLDGELSDAERAMVETWLEEDEHARALLEELRKSTALVGALPRMRAPEHLADDVAEQIERSALLGEEPAQLPIEPHKGSGWRRGLAIAASIALVVTAGWYMWPNMKGMVDHEPDVITLAEAPNVPEPTEPKTADREKKNALAVPSADADDDVKVAKEEAAEDTLFSMGRRDERKSPHRRAGERRVHKQILDEKAKGEHRSPDVATDSEDEGAVVAEGMPEKLSMPRLARAGRGRTLTDVPEKPAKGTGDSGSAPSAILTNAAIRSLNSSNAGNTLVVETDAATQHKIVSYLNTFIADNNIPSAKGNTFSEPIPPTQKFYVDAGNALSETEEHEEANTHGQAREVCVVFNAPAKEVEELLSNVARIRSQNSASMNWTANSLSPTEDDVTAAMALLKTGTPTNEASETLVTFADDSSENAITHPTQEAPANGETGKATPPAVEKATKDKSETSEEKATPAPPPTPGREKARPDTGEARGRVGERRAVIRRATKPTAVSDSPSGRERKKSPHAERRLPSPTDVRPGKGAGDEPMIASSQPSEEIVSPYIQVAMIFRSLPVAPTTTAPVDADGPAEPDLEKSPTSRPHSPSPSTSQPTSQGAARG